jgi:uncharacterized iron-regulated membrane protein
MTLRKSIFWIHLIAGLAAGLVIFTMSFTGILLAYEKQFVSWADRKLLGGPPPQNASRVSLQPIADSVMGSSGGAVPTAITFYSNKRAVAAAAGGKTFYVDSYSGNVLGTGSAKVRDFFRSVTNWHRYLSMSGDRRAIGRSITGVSNLIFLIVVIVGLLLWIPRGKANWRTIRNVTWFRRNQSLRARNWNWHNVFGVWAFLPLFFIVLSGAVISYPWASKLVYRATGTTPPNPEINRGVQDSNNRSAPVLRLAGMDPLVAIAERQISEWKTIRLQVPPSDRGPVSFTIDRGDGGDPKLRSTLRLGRATGSVVSLEKFEDQDAGRRARTWFRFVHTGEYYGRVGQGIAATACFAACMLVWTGFDLSWRRWRSWMTNRKSRPITSEVKSPIGGTDAA